MQTFTFLILFAATVSLTAALQSCDSIDCGGYACCQDSVQGAVCIYQPDLYTCAAGIRLCGVGLGVCDTVCYDQSMYYCNNGVITQLPASSPTHTASPSPTVAHTSAPTQKATSTPTHKATTSPTQKATAAPTHKATTAPTQKATSAPTQKATAAPTQKATSAPTSAPTSCAQMFCGGYACCDDVVSGPLCIYQPDQFVCASGRLCPVGDGVCGTACYNQSIYFCVNGVVTAHPSSSTSGGSTTGAAISCANTFCGTSACCDDAVTGPQCIYQPSLYTCASGVRLCPVGDGECNLNCYDQSLYYCNNGVITQLGQ